MSNLAEPPASSAREPSGPRGWLTRSWRGERPLCVGVGLAGGLGLGLGFLPLLGGPGYETSVVAGLLLPALAANAEGLRAVSKSLQNSRVRAEAANPAEQPEPYSRPRDGLNLRALDVIGHGLWSGTLIWLSFVLLNSFHGLRLGWCDPASDLELMLLGPGFGALAGGAWGGVVGLFLRRRIRRRLHAGSQVKPRSMRILTLAAALALPLASIGVSVVRFVTSPMVFAYDPFVGYFSGSIYDTVINAQGLLTYRLGTLATLAALSCAAFHVELGPQGKLYWQRRGRPGVLLLAAAALLVSVGITISGPTLGHYYTTADIKHELGGEYSYGRCDLAYDAALPRGLMIATARDCDAHIHQLEAFFGAPGPERVTAYFFANGQQKQRLMGAMNVYIAKPWRREVYLQAQGYPHPVLGHELAHVVSGAYAKGPFKVPGRMLGVFANPGLIEGTAVAAAPDEDADLTLQQWARAMLDLKLLPSLERVFHLGFLGENSSTAYTVAGAFVEWFRTEQGKEALRRWYGGETLRAITGKDLEGLEQDWLQSLQKVEVPPAAMGVAKARFDRPAVFGRHCPHTVDRLLEQARALASNDPNGSLKACSELLALEPENLGARLAKAKATVSKGDLDDARKQYRAIADDQRLSTSQRAMGLEELADLELSQGSLEAAKKTYGEVLKATVGEDRLRSVELRRDMNDPRARSAMVALLIGSSNQQRDWIDAASQLGRWAEAEPDNGLPEYLIGRNLYGNGRFDLAEPRLLAASRKRIDNAKSRAENWRTLLFVACARGDIPVGQRAFAAYAREPGVPPARLSGVTHFAERCGLSVARASAEK
ncbi:MAG: hypothetical protein H6716_06975 [Polyangiaceae bacterium]|nr:hypothetical protein [Polyangiaceae bacterium]